MAPMAGGVANGEEDRFVLGARFGERFFAPRAPIYGVVCVLQEVGRAFGNKAVRHRVSLM